MEEVQTSLSEKYAMLWLDPRGDPLGSVLSYFGVFLFSRGRHQMHQVEDQILVSLQKMILKSVFHKITFSLQFNCFTLKY